MKVSKLFLASGLVSVFTTSIHAEDKQEAKKPLGHCEKSMGDGSVEDIEATDKADCKSKGGKWNKAKKDDHGHASGDGHDHK